MKRFAALYAILVGVPVLALLVILRLGSGIEPPLSVGGKWRVEVNGFTADVGRAGLAEFSIAQSGPRLDVKVASEVQPAQGRIDGRRVWAERRREGSVAWRLEARLVSADTLAGEWQVVEEAGNRAIPFEARRQRAGAATLPGH